MRIVVGLTLAALVACNGTRPTISDQLQDAGVPNDAQTQSGLQDGAARVADGSVDSATSHVVDAGLLHEPWLDVGMECSGSIVTVGASLPESGAWEGFAQVDAYLDSTILDEGFSFGRFDVGVLSTGDHVIVVRVRSLDAQPHDLLLAVDEWTGELFYASGVEFAAAQDLKCKRNIAEDPETILSPTYDTSTWEAPIRGDIAAPRFQLPNRPSLHTRYLRCGNDQSATDATYRIVVRTH